MDSSIYKKIFVKFQYFVREVLSLFKIINLVNFWVFFFYFYIQGGIWIFWVEVKEGWGVDVFGFDYFWNR